MLAFAKLALLAFLGAGAAATRPGPPQQLGPAPLWSLHAGAPLSGAPAVGAEGTIALGTTDGYVHALRSNGAFRFSYTVAGRVLGSPVVFGDGLVLAASDQRRLYALKLDGGLLWDANVAGGVASALALDRRERVWLRTGAGTAIAMSRRGGVVGFAKVGRSMTLGPIPIASGEVIVGNPDGELGVIGDHGRYRTQPVAGGLASIAAISEGFVTLGRGGLTAYRSDASETWSRPAARRLLCAMPLVTLEDGAVVWLDRSGGVEAQRAVAERVEGPSTCTGSSVFAVTKPGHIVQLRRNGARSSYATESGGVASLQPLGPGALLVAYRDGRLAAVKVTE